VKLILRSSSLVVTLAVVAAAVQLLYIFESHRHLVFQVPLVDAAAYHNQAMALAMGQTPAPRAFWQPPLYPYALSVPYRMEITDLRTVRCLHALLGIAAALLIFAVGRRCGGVRVGFLAGLGLCCYGPLLFFFSQLLPTGLAVTLNLAAILLLLRLTEKPTWPRALALGLTVGLATLTVPNSAVMILIALGWIAVQTGHLTRQDPNQNRDVLRLALALVAGLIIVIAPVTIRNYSVSGEFVPISTNGGINLYIGNNPHPEETLTIRPGLDWERLVAMPYRLGAKTDTEAERFFVNKVVTFAWKSPLEYIRGLLEKTQEAFTSREIPRNEDINVFAGHSAVLRALVWRIGSFAFPFGLIGPLAIVGALTLTRRHRARSLVLLFALGYMASVILFFPASRYLAPVIPAFVIFAVLGIKRLIELPTLPLLSRLASVGLLAVSGVLINLPRQLPTDRVNYEAEMHTNVGVGLQTRSRMEESIMEYREAIRLDPASADAHRYLGTAYRASGQSALAMQEFERAVALRPDHDAAIQDLAIIRYEQGHVEEAVELLRKVIALNPENRQAMTNLGVGLLRLNRRAEATQWFKKAGVASPSR